MKYPIFILILFLIQPAGAALAQNTEYSVVPVLLYHRLGLSVTDAMTVRTAVFAAQLAYLKSHDYTVIPLRHLTDYLAGKTTQLPARAVVICADDGHESVYTALFPLIRRYHVPVTLFIYPSAISNASYALTWQQLHEMQDSGLVDIQSHSYWHPNFKKEKVRLGKDAYEKFVRVQLVQSKSVLEKQFGKPVDMLAWPFGIYDDELIRAASAAGYVAAFTIERRAVSHTDNVMALPRFLMTDQVQFEKLLAASPSKASP